MILKIRGLPNNKRNRNIVKVQSFDNFSIAKDQLPMAIENPYGDSEFKNLPFLPKVKSQ